VEEREERGGAVRVGLIWGGIGGVVAFLVSLLGSLAGILVAGFVGYSCGRRAAEAGRWTGALSGLVGGAVAAPAYVLGSAFGALVAVREIGAARISATLSDMARYAVSPTRPGCSSSEPRARGVPQATLLILASTAAEPGRRVNSQHRATCELRAMAAARFPGRRVTRILGFS
jgi:hypothetical protein